MPSRFINGLTAEDKIISTVPNGTPPLQVASSTQVDNLNASLVGGVAAANIYHTTNKPTATDVGLGNVTNESKGTMFTNSVLTGDTKADKVTIANKFKFDYNSTEDSLDLVYVGD